MRCYGGRGRIVKPARDDSVRHCPGEGRRFPVSQRDDRSIVTATPIERALRVDSDGISCCRRSLARDPERTR